MIHYLTCGFRPDSFTVNIWCQKTFGSFWTFCKPFDRNICWTCCKSLSLIKSNFDRYNQWTILPLYMCQISDSWFDVLFPTCFFLPVKMWYHEASQLSEVSANLWGILWQNGKNYQSIYNRLITQIIHDGGSRQNDLWLCSSLRLQKRVPAMQVVLSLFHPCNCYASYEEYLLGRARSPVNHHIDSGIMFAVVLIKEINSLFAMGIFNKENPMIIDGSVSRLMFCYYSMIYIALKLNNSFCWDSTSSRWNESEVSSSKSSLERIALSLVCRLLSADKISFTISHHQSELTELVFFRWTHTASRGSSW